MTSPSCLYIGSMLYNFWQTSGIDELEAFLAALRLSFLTSSSTTQPQESLRHGIAAFRETLRPRGTLAATLPSVEAYTRKEDDISNCGGDALGEPENPRSATPTVWSSEDRVDVASQLTDQIELVNTEVREGTRQIRELLQNMKELRAEVQDLRSALVVSKAAAGSEGYSQPPTLSKTASLTTVQEAQVDPSPKQSSGKPPGSLLSTTAHSQSISACGRSESVSKPPTSFVAPESPFAAKLPTPRGPSQPSSSVAVSAPFHTQIAVPVDATGSSPPVFLGPSNVSGIELPLKAEDPEQEIPNVKPQKRTSRPAKKRRDAKAEVQTRFPNDESQMDAKDVTDSRMSIVTWSTSKSPVIATAVDGFYTSNKGEVRFEQGEKIVVLDSPNTPVGWMYGEVTEKRRGIFPARHVQEFSRADVNGGSDNRRASESTEATDLSSESSVMVTALEYFIGSRPNDLRLRAGDKIAIVEAPDTPVGWMCGEIVKKRRGIFPARYVTIDKD